MVRKLDESYESLYQASLRSYYPHYSVGDVSNPPTEAELNTLFGSPTVVGAGFLAILNDAGAEANEYLIWSDGTKWWYIAGTVAS